MDSIKKIIEQVDSLTMRERGIILAGIIFVLYTIWDMFLIGPQLVSKNTIISQLQVKRGEQSVLNLQYQQLIKQVQGDPDAENRNRLAELKRQLESVEATVRESASYLVAPESMAGILRTILSRSNDLKLIRVKGLGASPLLSSFDQGQAETEADTGINTQAPQAAAGLESAYKHGLQIEFEGSYLSTLSFMRDIESLEWGFFWDNLVYEVIDYPTGNVVITLYTVSLDKNWIGV
jgi:MSHA biogenesis protein MshJ